MIYTTREIIRSSIVVFKTTVKSSQFNFQMKVLLWDIN